MELSQYQEWRDYYVRNPWGPTRDDMRFGAMLSILMSSLGGTGTDTKILYPYFESSIDWEAELKEAQRIEAELVDNGKGGYMWKGGKRPDGIRDRS